MFYAIYCNKFKPHYTSNFNLISDIKSNLINRYNKYQAADFTIESIRLDTYIEYAHGSLFNTLMPSYASVKLFNNLYLCADTKYTPWHSVIDKFNNFKKNNLENNIKYTEKYDYKFCKFHTYNSVIVLSLSQIKAIENEMNRISNYLS